MLVPGIYLAAIASGQRPFTRNLSVNTLGVDWVTITTFSPEGAGILKESIEPTVMAQAKLVEAQAGYDPAELSSDRVYSKNPSEMQGYHGDSHFYLNKYIGFSGQRKQRRPDGEFHDHFMVRISSGAAHLYTALLAHSLNTKYPWYDVREFSCTRLDLQVTVSHEDLAKLGAQIGPSVHEDYAKLHKDLSAYFKLYGAQKRKVDIYLSGKAEGSKEDTGQGATVTIGSRQSDRYARVYSKKMWDTTSQPVEGTPEGVPPKGAPPIEIPPGGSEGQPSEKPSEVALPQTVSVIGDRFEVELKGETSKGVFIAMLSSLAKLPGYGPFEEGQFLALVANEVKTPLADYIRTLPGDKRFFAPMLKALGTTEIFDWPNQRKGPEEDSQLRWLVYSVFPTLKRYAESVGPGGSESLRSKLVELTRDLLEKLPVEAAIEAVRKAKVLERQAVLPEPSAEDKPLKEAPSIAASQLGDLLSNTLAGVSPAQPTVKKKRGRPRKDVAEMAKKAASPTHKPLRDVMPSEAKPSAPPPRGRPAKGSSIKRATLPRKEAKGEATQPPAEDNPSGTEGT